MQNALGMKDGKPIVGSTWQFTHDAGWDVLAVGKDVEIVGRANGSMSRASLQDFGSDSKGSEGRYVFLAYPNAMGLDAKGRPLDGSKWRLISSDKWFQKRPIIYTVAPGERYGGVPFAENAHDWMPLASFKGELAMRLVELPPEPAAANDDRELTWTPIERPMLNLEEEARNYEIAGNHERAQASRRFAATMAEMDARIAAEESALKDHRYIAKRALAKLTPGDRACYEMKTLKEFEQHTEGAGFLYWD